MVWTINAVVHTATDLPGAVDLTITGEQDVDIKVWRNEPTWGSAPVRNATHMPVSGALRVVDAEAPFNVPVTYTVEYDGAYVADSNVVVAPPMPSGFALIRSVLRPDVQWMPVAFVDETGTEWPTTSTAHMILDSHDTVVVGDTRKRRRGVFTFAARTPIEASRLVYLLRDGIPFLLRLCPNGQEAQRDTLFYALSVTEVRVVNGLRRVAVEFQSVDWVSGETQVPPVGSWTYAELRDQTSAATYANIPPMRTDYLDLLLRPITP